MFDSENRLTHYDNVAENLIVRHVRAIPSMMPELVSALAQSKLGALADGGHGVGRFSALLALTLRQAGDATADRSSYHHCTDHPETKIIH